MKHHSALLLNKIAWASLTVLTLLSGARSAHAQIPFDDLDWLMDRGQILRIAPLSNGAALRQGAPNINSLSNGQYSLNAGHAEQRFVWPRTEDLPSVGNPTVIVDNPDTLDTVYNYFDTNNNEVRVQPAPPNQTGNNPTLMQHAYLYNGWTLPAVVPGAAGDYRSPLGGYSESTNLLLASTDDYAFTYATQYTFDPNISDADLAAMPYPVGSATFPANQVYAAVNTAVLTSPQIAQYTSGSYNMTAGSYSVDFYSPGSGTVINGVVTPSAFRGFVRVSYGGPGVNTLNADGSINQAGVNNTVYSRIYEVDFGSGGWTHIQAGGLSPAVFPYSGNALQPIVVTIYSITPDSLTDPEYSSPPVITADACRFLPVAPPTPTGTTVSPLINPNNTSMQIGADGRILGPVVGTNKITQDDNGVALTNTPLFYVAREESYVNTIANFPTDPTQPISATNPIIIDPTQLITEPVFYCLESEPEVLNPGGTPVNSNPSWHRVIWRFVGEADVLTPTGAGDNSGTSAASPYLANVRCRDGNVRTIVYFLTTNSDGALGHIYALDPAGNSVTQTTTPYWVYPSFRPLLTADAANPLLPFEYHDPNYYNHTTGGVYADGGYYKLTSQWWAPDENLVPSAYNEFYDGDLVADPTNANNLVVQQDTLVSIAGLLGNPAIIDDPSPSAGVTNPPQLLIVPTLDGHVFAFDAGGRGDYTDQNGNTLVYTDPVTGFVYNPGGTTQRMWAWPHYAGDAYHWVGLTGANTNTQGAQNPQGLPEPTVGSFPGSIAYDNSYPATNKPVMVGGGDGHFYALFTSHDNGAAIEGSGVAVWNERRDWVYPAADNAGLNGAPSSAAIFQPTNSATKNVYFTVSDSLNGGRVYSVPEAPTTSLTSGVTTNSLNWVFPSTPNPPAPSPTNSLSAGIFPGFSGQAPVLMNQATINLQAPANAQVSTDICYVVGSDSTLFAIDAIGGSNGNNPFNGAPANDGYDPIYSGQTLTASAEESSPVGGLLIGLPGVAFTDISTPHPALIYADDAGAIWGMSATLFNDPIYGTQPGTYGNSGLLAPVWGFNDSSQARVAAAGIVGGDLLLNPAPGNALIYEGDEGGQLRCYGFGTGLNGLGNYTNGVEPQTPGFGAGYVSIDLRTVDVYAQTDWNKFYQGGAAGSYETPLNFTNGAGAQTGAKLANSATPLDLGLGTGAQGQKVIIADWGDTLYVGIAGVYHALPNGAGSTALAEYGTTPPTITVTVTFSQPGGTTTRTLTAVMNPALNGGWPDDLGVLPGEHNNLSIYGIDPSNMGTSVQQLTGPAQNVFPWVATTTFPINPQNGSNLAPGTNGYALSARAVITQTITSTSANISNQLQTNESVSLRAGQHDGVGLNSIANGTPYQVPGYITQTPAGGLPAGAGPPASPPSILGVANPLAVTFRNYNSPALDQTGANQPNIIGWYNSLLNVGTAPPNLITELINNGNSLVSPFNRNATANATAKPLFGALPMVPDGSTSTYMADNAGTPVAGIFVADRSNLYSRTSNYLKVRMIPKAANWHGFSPSLNPGSFSAVMNALPWEQLPTDAQSTRDYPSIGTNSIAISLNGADATQGGANLLPPIGSGQNRVMQPTPAGISVQVPKYQPANVNSGLASFGGLTFGSPYQDVSGNYVGSGGTRISGPTEITTGLAAPLNATYAYPAGGYLADVTIQTVAPNATTTGTPNPGTTPTTGGSGFDPGTRFGSTRGGGAAAPVGTGAGATGVPAYRFAEIGLSVPPRIALSTVQQTIDLGYEPHGTGYSPPLGGNPLTPSVPFSPNFLSDYPAGNSPYDNASIFGNFFQGFSVINDSNVNLVDVRAAKITGQAGAALGVNAILPGANPGTGAAALQLTSDEAASANTPVFGMPLLPFTGGGGQGYIGLITSLDHISINSNNSASFPERPLWGKGAPVNPYVLASDINAALSNGAILQTSNSPANGFLGWAAGFQPQPTIGKSRVGDSSGRLMTIPDRPYNAPATPIGGVQFNSPELGLAIPEGTPVGTYSAPVYIFEDNTPIQWREWLSHGSAVDLGTDHDGMLNTSAGTSPSPLEAFTNPGITVKVTVRESKLSRGSTAGDLSELDYINPLNSALRDWQDPNHPAVVAPPGADTTPAAWIAPGAGANNSLLQLVWSTNRRPSPGDPYIDGGSGLVESYAPWGLAFSATQVGYASPGFSPQSGLNAYSDYQFQRPGAPAWWSQPNLFVGASYSAPAQWATVLAGLFPSTAAEAAATGIPGMPYLAGTAVPSTEHHSNPSITSSGSEAYLFWVSQVMKTQASGGLAGAPQVLDSRIFWEPMTATGPGGTSWSMANDPSTPKGGPRALLLNLAAANGAPAQKFLYVFWHQGRQSKTSLYYNVAATAPGSTFSATGTPFQTIDQELQVPNALNWETDPTPIHRTIPYNGALIDVIDVVYTGVLKNRQNVETLLSRYQIVRTSATPGLVGTLQPLPLPPVSLETAARQGSTGTFITRDAAWTLGSGPGGSIAPTDTMGNIALYGVPVGGAATLLNPESPGSTNPSLGKYDQASGLIFYDSAVLGGQIVVDPRSGTISFPQVGPKQGSSLLVSYAPQVMRLNVSRNDPNLNHANTGPGPAPASYTGPHPVQPPVGNNTQPIAFLDTGANPRNSLASPQVVFGGAMPTDRFWLFYKKVDPSNATRTALYYHAMRLMVTLPFPVLLNNNNQIASLTVNGNVGPYEVDWIRGRIFFTEVDEARPITVQYSWVNGGATGSSNLNYVVAWGDEQVTANTNDTTSETPVMMGTVTNEGTVNAFKDPFVNKVWLFWSSTRASSTDLYYETISPQFYATASNQQ